MSQLRDAALQSIRINLELPIDTSGHSDRISFQNEVLRPILKFQHDILVLAFQEYIDKKKFSVENSDSKKVESFIEKAFANDQLWKKNICGLITGHFTSIEYASYLVDKRETDKRIITMATKRIVSVFVERPITFEE